jgi:Lar family restriction alleviation protein
MSEELKPCPFCGSNASYWLDSNYQDRHVIECDDCGVERRYEHGETEARNIWNTRHITLYQAKQVLAEGGMICISKAEFERLWAFYAELDGHRARMNMTTTDFGNVIESISAAQDKPDA